MPRVTTTDISLTKSYIPKVSKISGISPTIAKFYKSIENCNIYEGRVVDQAYYKSNNIERLFTNIRFDCLFKINEPIVPRFILDFYSQVTVQTDEYGYLVISFMIQHEFITLTLAQFGQILKIPYNGQAVFTNEWDLASLEYSQETEGPYSTDLPTPNDIRRLLELERVMVDRTMIRCIATFMLPLITDLNRMPLTKAKVKITKRIKYTSKVSMIKRFGRDIPMSYVPSRLQLKVIWLDEKLNDGETDMIIN
ncbi:hypothetical protein Tco_0105003 [Tanacetum coccineum]